MPLRQLHPAGHLDRQLERHLKRHRLHGVLALIFGRLSHVLRAAYEDSSRSQCEIKGHVGTYNRDFVCLCVYVCVRVCVCVSV